MTGLKGSFMVPNREDQYSPEETKRRMESAISRALNTPPKPHSKMVGKGKRGRGKEKSRVKNSGY
jgi:hypothetical protein